MEVDRKMVAVPKGKKPGRMKPKRKRNAKHLAFVAKQPCCCCGRVGVSVHHLIGYYGEDGPITGKGLRADDRWTIPICYEHHQGQSGLHSNGNEEKFLKAYGVNGPQLARILWGASQNG